MNQNTEINKSLNYYRKYKENCTRLNSKTKTHEKKIYIWNKNINLYFPLLGGGALCQGAFVIDATYISWQDTV